MTYSPTVKRGMEELMPVMDELFGPVIPGGNFKKLYAVAVEPRIEDYHALVDEFPSLEIGPENAVEFLSFLREGSLNYLEKVLNLPLNSIELKTVDELSPYVAALFAALAALEENKASGGTPTS